MKLTKAEVSYGPGKLAEHCGICIHFIAYQNRGLKGGCTIVQGPIDWRDWCKKFDKATPFAK
jgi:hypothetical protein